MTTEALQGIARHGKTPICSRAKQQDHDAHHGMTAANEKATTATASLAALQKQIRNREGRGPHHRVHRNTSTQR